MMVQNYKVEEYLDDRDPEILKKRRACPFCNGTATVINFVWKEDACAYCAWGNQLLTRVFAEPEEAKEIRRKLRGK
jgi:hypothetical protein